MAESADSKARQIAAFKLKKKSELETYFQQLVDRLKGGIPEKHRHRVDSFKRFLGREMAKTRSTIDHLA